MAAFEDLEMKVRIPIEDVTVDRNGYSYSRDVIEKAFKEAENPLPITVSVGDNHYKIGQVESFDFNDDHITANITIPSGGTTETAKLDYRQSNGKDRICIEDMILKSISFTSQGIANIFSSIHES